jgi:microtubule-associated protein-like 6
LCLSKLLIGTRGSDIFEAVLPKLPTDPFLITTLSRGHYSGDLCGLASHPKKDIVATCGGDKTLRVWSILDHSQISMCTLPNIGTCLTFNTQGDRVVVGLDDGTVIVLNAETTELTTITSWKHCSRPISDIKFATQDLYLAVGCRDTSVYLYRGLDEKNGSKKTFVRHSVCKGHSGAITHIDFTTDIKYLRSCGAEGAVLYWTIGGVQVKSSSSLRDVTWATNSAVFAWGTQGIWPPGSDFTDVNSCDASPDLGVIISGDDFKKVNLYRYPCVVKGAVRLTYTGHGSHVMGVVLSCSRQYVASIGGADNSLLVWNHFLEIEDSDADNATVSSSGSASASASAKSNVGAHSDDWLMNEPTQGDEFMAVKPWKSAIIEPSQWEEATGASDCDLALQWVHGFSVTRPLFSSNYLFYSSAGDIVYPAAALGIIYRKNTKKQCFIQGAHDDEILSMAIHPSGQIFASGQSGKNAAIVVWNSDDTQTIRRLDKAHQRGVSQLAFNTQGNLLASLGLDNDNSLAIHNWSSGIEILRTPIDKGKVLCLCFFHLDSDVSSKSSEETVVTGGEKLLKFWTFQGKNVKSQRAMWGDYKRTTVLSVVSGSKGTCITGTKEGDLLLWKDYKVTYSVNLFNFRILSNHHGIYFY